MGEQTSYERRREQSGKCGRSVRAHLRPFFVGPQLSTDAHSSPCLLATFSLVFLPHPLWYVRHIVLAIAYLSTGRLPILLDFLARPQPTWSAQGTFTRAHSWKKCTRPTVHEAQHDSFCLQNRLRMYLQSQTRHPF